MEIQKIIKDDLTVIQQRIRYYENQMRISLSDSITYERLLAKHEVLKDLLDKCSRIKQKNRVIKSDNNHDDLPF